MIIEMNIMWFENGLDFNKDDLIKGFSEIKLPDPTLTNSNMTTKQFIFCLFQLTKNDVYEIADVQ